MTPTRNIPTYLTSIYIVQTRTYTHLIHSWTPRHGRIQKDPPLEFQICRIVDGFNMDNLKLCGLALLLTLEHIIWP